MRWLLILMLFANVSSVFSQGIPVDLELTITAEPPFPWRIGQEGRVRMNVTNHSKTQGTVALIQLVPAIPPNVPPTDGFEPLGESCMRSAECTVFGLLCSETPPIDPGATVSCDFNLKAVISYGRPGRSRQVVYHEFGFSGFTDPDLSNNTAQIELGILPNLTQVPLTPSSYALMLILIGVVGVVAARGLRSGLVQA